MKRQKYNSDVILQHLGMTEADAQALRRIASTLHNWHELECGTDQGHISREGGTPIFYPRSQYRYQSTGYSIPDRERGALKRLAAIMAAYPTLDYYVQRDPRGCSLYILRPDDVPASGEPDSYYSRGIAVYKGYRQRRA